LPFAKHGMGKRSRGRPRSAAVAAMARRRLCLPVGAPVKSATADFMEAAPWGEGSDARMGMRVQPGTGPVISLALGTQYVIVTN